MAINFDELPKEKAGGTIEGFENGLYTVKVEAADMVANKDPNKKPYLNVRLGVYSEKGARITGVFDIFADSTHPLVLYKLRKFIEACKINMQGSFELKDLPKIIVNKSLRAFLKLQKDPQYGDKIIVDIAPDEIYMPLDADETAPLTKPSEVPFEPDIVSEDEIEY